MAVPHSGAVFVPISSAASASSFYSRHRASPPRVSASSTSPSVASAAHRLPGHSLPSSHTAYSPSAPTSSIASTSTPASAAASAVSSTSFPSSDSSSSVSDLEDSKKRRGPTRRGLLAVVSLTTALLVCLLLGLVLPPGRPLFTLPNAPLLDTQLLLRYTQDSPLLSPSASTAPALLAPYLSDPSLSASYQRRFHNGFFNEAYMRGRSTAADVAALAASNRALPHRFPSPLPLSASELSHSLVVGVFCFDVGRIEVLLDTWGKYLLPHHLMVFSEPNADPELQRRQEAMPQVVVLSNARNEGRNVTERRASAWKVLPAVQAMYERHPSSQWFYLCDDDSFPVLPNIAAYLRSFHANHPTYAASDALYIGQSVEQALKARSYYADEEGRDVSLRYHCTGGGVVMNLPLVQRLQPHLSSCFVFFASDLSLGHCIQQRVPDARLVEVQGPQYLYAQTLEQAVSKFSLDESGVWTAGAFHHMREPFISQWGVNDRLEQFLRESELRTYAAYLHSTHRLRALRLLSEGAGDGDAVRLLLLWKGPDMAAKGVASVGELAALLSGAEEGWQPLAFLSELGWDTDVAVVDEVDRGVCGVCDLYSDTARGPCVAAYQRAHGRLYPHVQRQQRSGHSPLHSSEVRLSTLSLSSYHLVVSLDALLQPSAAVSALFVHFSHPSCSFPFHQPPAPYRFALYDGLALVDEVATRETSTQPFLLPFPSLSLFYGAYHALQRVDQPLHARREATLLVLSRSDVSSQFEAAAAAGALSTRWLSSASSPLPLAELSRSRLCLFPPGLGAASAASLAAAERSQVARLLLSAVAAGCLALASEEVARWGLRGERVEAVEAGGSLSVVLGDDSTVGTEAALLAAVARLKDERAYGVAVALQRAALNAHLLEKPWHLLLQPLSQHWREQQRT